MDEVVCDADVFPRLDDVSVSDVEYAVAGYCGQVAGHVGLVSRVPRVCEPQAVLYLGEDLVPRPVPGLHKDRVRVGVNEPRVPGRLRLELLRGRRVVEIGLQDPLADEEVPPGRYPFGVEALARDGIRGAVVVQGELRRCDPLPDFLAERRKTRQDGPRAESAANLIGQGTEDERVEEDRVTARLRRFRGPGQGRDPPGLLSGLFRFDLGELGGTGNPMTARLQRNEGTDRQIEAGPVVVALHAIRRGKEVLVLVLPEGPRTLLRPLVHCPADGGVHVLP